MNRSSTDLPERLLAADATDFERRLLEAALKKGPPPGTSARVARALGVTAMVAAPPVAAAKTLAADAAASKTVAAAGTTTWPWVSIAVVGLAVAGGVVGPRAWRAASSGSRAPLPAVAAPPSTVAPPSASDRPVAPAATAAHDLGGDLGDQIALIDAAKAAVSAGANRRAMEILRRYEDRHPAGSFRPEATALKVEVLVKLGRAAEARALAERFVAQHRGSLLARRVAELAGLGEPSAAP
jgi:hypothetical protein